MTMMRALFASILFLMLVTGAWAQTVRIDGQEIPYRMVEGKQMVSRSDLAQAFPGFPDGEGMVDLQELIKDPNARIMRRNGLIISIRYYNSNMAAMYNRNRPAPDPNRAAILEAGTQTNTGFQYQAMMDEIVRLSNEQRQAHGIPPVTAHITLEQAATAHSTEMAQLGYFSHDSPTPGRENPHKRIKSTGSNARTTGENIATFTGHPEASIASKSVIGWMNSPPHRKNLLDPSFTHMGIGVARTGQTFYVTQNFSDLP